MTAGSTGTTAADEPALGAWGAGAVAGLVAGVGMGVLLQAGTDLLPLIGALYGLPTLLGGWLAHLFNSVVFGLLFVAVVTRRLLADYETTAAALVGLGVGYGAALGVLTGGILLPLWLSAAGAADLPVPLFPVPGVATDFVTPLVLGVAHLVYGALLGGVYAFLHGPAAVDLG